VCAAASANAAKISGRLRVFGLRLEPRAPTTPPCCLSLLYRIIIGGVAHMPKLYVWTHVCHPTRGKGAGRFFFMGIGLDRRYRVWALALPRENSALFERDAQLNRIAFSPEFARSRVWRTQAAAPHSSRRELPVQRIAMCCGHGHNKRCAAAASLSKHIRYPWHARRPFSTRTYTSNIK